MPQDKRICGWASRLNYALNEIEESSDPGQMISLFLPGLREIVKEMREVKSEYVRGRPAPAGEPTSA